MSLVVGRSCKHCALFYAETVLLVCYAKAEVFKLNALLNKGMGSYKKVGLAVFYSAIYRFFL